MYFNYATSWPASWWERRSFLKAWWRIYAGDPRWAPPACTALAQLLQQGGQARITGSSSQPLYLEALPRRSALSDGGGSFSPNVPATPMVAFEEPVAAAIVQIDRRRGDDIAYLSLLRCVNDEETLDRLLQKAFEHAAEQGCSTLVGPTGIVPGWQDGVLLDHFHRPPPWHTPYNPPYAADLYAGSMQPWLETVLYTYAFLNTPDPSAMAPGLPVSAAEGVRIESLAPARLAGDLLPLLAAALDWGDYFPPVDAPQAATLLAWLQSTVEPQGFLATVGGAPAGFVLLQPDLSPLFQRTHGGRGWLGRAWLALRKHAPTTAGRLLLGAVAAEWRGRGIALLLWRHALNEARARGWQTLTCGPVAPQSPAATFLQNQGATPQQHYTTYSWSPW